MLEKAPGCTGMEKEMRVLMSSREAAAARLGCPGYRARGTLDEVYASVVALDQLIAPVQLRTETGLVRLLLGRLEVGVVA